LSTTKTHHYRIQTTWTGNLGTGTSAYRDYSRNHEISAANKGTVVQGSSDPLYRGDAARYNPEELLLAALASCHMLWVLHLSADAGIVITSYRDEAIGDMVEHPDGSGEFTHAVLRPRIVISDAARIEEAVALHDRAHHLCCLARSMAFPVTHEVEVTATA
jgi:organic hydroperoxide reductase OsmC/OhrA